MNKHTHQRQLDMKTSLPGKRIPWLLLILCIAWPAHGQGDSYLDLGVEGYAQLPHDRVSDLDYTQDITVEAAIMVHANRGGGRWSTIVSKAEKRASYLVEQSGWLLGLDQGHIQSYGQVVMAKVGDGLEHVVVRAKERQGVVYAVMVWRAYERSLTLYINGEQEACGYNEALDFVKIANEAPLGLGLSGGYYAPLGRDMFFARLWNRRLSNWEIKHIWQDFRDDARHQLPSEVSRDDLHSEWLMHETCSVNGQAGHTHIRDTMGSNHLLLKEDAVIRRGDAPLQLLAPADQATNVDKTVFLEVTGGQHDLQSPVVLPLQYLFEIDEDPGFDSVNLQQSGWQSHYSQWSPMLKPDTWYYWRAAVRDSVNPTRQRAWSQTHHFSTEGRSLWYVRPRNDQVVYGREDGTAYEHAFNGLVNWDERFGASPGLVWGPGGIEAGDTLYICGIHESLGQQGGFVEQRRFYIMGSGHSEQFPITIHGGHPVYPGLIKGLEDGYIVTLERQKHVLFKRLHFEGFDLRTEVLTEDGDDVTQTEHPRSTHITFEDCTMTHGGDTFVELTTGHDFWTFRRNTLIHGGLGIHTLEKGGHGARYLTAQHNTIKHMGFAPYGHPDAHGIGIQGGQGHLIEGNIIENTGTAIELWTANQLMRDIIIRYNLIKQVRKMSNTLGTGIAISGANKNSLGQRTGIKVYNNIIVGAEGAGIGSNNKDRVDISNNTIYRCHVGLQLRISNAPLNVAVHNNMILYPEQCFVYVSADSNWMWFEVEWDHNLYYPWATHAKRFYTSQIGYRDFKTYSHETQWDQHAMIADPLLQADWPSRASDFMVRDQSPAIDAGKDVGIPKDFVCQPIPQGRAPDIGAFEHSNSPANVSDH